MPFTFTKATRQGVTPLLCLYSESGCGKTYSALALARGMAGPSGKIVVGDSEAGRARLYADLPEFGGYECADVAAPFSPAKFIDLIDSIEASGAAVGVIDSGSHEWEGTGGILDLHGEAEERSGKPGLHNWRKPKFEHALFVSRLMRCKIPLIICLRAKYKSRQTRDGGKTVIVRDDRVSPMQAEDFIFEMTAHAEILPDHSIILTKCSHPDLRKCFPADRSAPLSVANGQAIARWCSGGAKESTPAAGPSKRKTRLVEVLTAEMKDAALAYAIDRGLIMPNEGLDSWPESRVPSTSAEMDSLKQAIRSHSSMPS